MLNRKTLKGSGKYGFDQASVKITDIIMLNDDTKDITVDVSILNSEGQLAAKIVKGLVIPHLLL